MSSPENPSVGVRMKKRWAQLRDWRSRTWIKIRPGPEARRGAVWAILAAVVWAAIVAAINLHSGFGLWFDLAFAFTIAALGIPLVALIVALLLLLLRKLPPFVSGLIFGACLFISLPWPPPFGPIIGIAFGLMEGVLGATIATILIGNLAQAALSKKVITAVLCAVAMAANIAVWVFFAKEGVAEDSFAKEMASLKQTAATLPPTLRAANPAERGSYTFHTLLYGNGTDIRRPEYGKSVALKTTTVDASKFFKDFKGWKANLRRRYWGFGMDKLPLNGRVWWPDGPGPFPLALMVHGNHGMAEFSDPGYAYLGELLASRGFIFVSIDENFLNSGLFHDPPKQQAVRGWMLLEHLRIWRVWNSTPGNPFYQRVDLDNVALMGHSRGGEAAATAALFNKLPFYPDDATIRFNYGFPIKSVVAIAPVDGQYKPAGQWRYIENVNYLTLQGANDADVSSFDGSRQWDHVRYTAGSAPQRPASGATPTAGAHAVRRAAGVSAMEAGQFPAGSPSPLALARATAAAPGTEAELFKAELYIYRANHGQFNTSWGRTDWGAPFNWLLNLRPLLSGDEQRRIGKIYISAFLEATLHNRREYVPLFRDQRTIRDWLPATLYISRYMDAASQVVTDFSEDPDLTTTTMPGGRIAGENLSTWREGRIPSRHGDRGYNGVFLGWNREHDRTTAAPPVATYSITLPEIAALNLKLSAQSVITLSLAVTEEKAEPPGAQDDKKKAADKKKEDKKKDEKPEPTDFTVELQASDGPISQLPLSRFGTLPPPFKVRFTKLAAMDDFAYQKASEPIFQTVDLALGTFAQQNSKFDPARLSTIRLRFDRTESRVVILSQLTIRR